MAISLCFCSRLDMDSKCLRTVILRIYLNFMCVCVCVCVQLQIKNAHRRLNITFKEENTDT